MNPAPKGSSQSPYSHEEYAYTPYLPSRSRLLANEEIVTHYYDGEHAESTQHARVPDESASGGYNHYVPVEDLAEGFGSLSMSSEPYGSYASQQYTSPTMNTYEQNESAYNSAGPSTHQMHGTISDDGVYFCTLATCPLKFDSIRERDRHFTTMHSNNGERPYRCLVDGCEARVTSWARPEKLKDHNKNWHGPYTCTVSFCSRGPHHGFRSQHDLDLHVSESHRLYDGGNMTTTPSTFSAYQPAYSTSQSSGFYSAGSEIPESSTSYPHNTAYGTYAATQRSDFYSAGSEIPESSASYQPYSVSGSQSTNLATKNPRLAANRATKRTHSAAGLNIRNNSPHQILETINLRFKIHPSTHFKLFKVIKVLWSEPAGATSRMDETDVTEDEMGTSKPGKNVNQKIRRFIIVRTYPGHSQCLPIQTYQHQGTTKPGVHAEDHSVVYTGNQPPQLLPGEQVLKLPPICVAPETPRDKLLPDSRINYAKIYTIEHNLKVAFTGEVSKGSQKHLFQSFDKVSSRGGLEPDEISDIL